jgi:hypothetical protein
MVELSDLYMNSQKQLSFDFSDLLKHSEIQDTFAASTLIDSTNQS